ncbi:nose resistant to fluoxetine protein 6 [Nephila pilipes]|uniref:Nose resistant to fluoxetine protein 6 n=1 Tax=Nephila pilipes TaxID=299642 RepID=A0A8X6N3M3_NEPPI|nr:nose resistant to fluoxetine protein 6 [Nephila pilipes]
MLSKLSFGIFSFEPVDSQTYHSFETFFIMNSCQRFSNKTLPWRGTKFETIFSAESLLKRLANAPTLEHQQRPKDLTTEATFMIFLFFIFVGLSAIGTSITVFEYFQRDRTKRKSSTNGNIPKKVVSSERKKTLKVSSDEANYMRFKSYLKCFCLLTNGRKLLSTASMENHFECIYGIRFLSILCVILGHVTQSYSITARYNEEMKMYFTTWLAQIVGNIYFVVDVFFVLSGFLNTYSILQDYHRSNGNISWINFYVIRFLRLTPGYMMILGLQATLFTHTGSGPLWPTFDTDPSCRENWWMNLLYINNFQSVYEQCMAWTWYIAADMQLFLLSPLFIIPLIR